MRKRILENQCLFDPTKFTKINSDILKENIINTSFIKELIDKGMLFGTITPNNNDLKDFLVIDFYKSSHRILSLEWKGDFLYGNVEILEENPYGKILMENLNNIHFSPRLLKNSDDCLRLITFDALMNK